MILRNLTISLCDERFVPRLLGRRIFDDHGDDGGGPGLESRGDLGGRIVHLRIPAEENVAGYAADANNRCCLVLAQDCLG